MRPEYFSILKVDIAHLYVHILEFHEQKGISCCLKRVVENMCQNHFAVCKIAVLLIVGKCGFNLTVCIKSNILKTGIKSDYKG